MRLILDNLEPYEFELNNGDRLKVKVENCEILRPRLTSQPEAKIQKVFPSEARQRAITYTGNCMMTLAWSKNGHKNASIDFDLGPLPIMIRSKACNLNGMKPKELVDKHEHEHEWGGYFVVKGNEKLIRMLLMTRRNYPIMLKRNTWKDRAKYFTPYGVIIRSVAIDHTSTNNVLHYLKNGTAKLMISHRKILSYLPVILVLKCLANYSDKKIFQDLLSGHEDDLYYKTCIQEMLLELHQQNIHSHFDAKNYLGQIFRTRFDNLPAWSPNETVADYLLKNNILIHLNEYIDKYNLLVFMTKKLFQAVQGKSKIESVDSVMMQELLTGGHLYQKIFKEFLESWMNNLRLNLNKKLSKDTSMNITAPDISNAGKFCGSLIRHFEYFLATGNLISRSGLGLMQSSGLVIMAENINRMRYMSHFRAVHRGSYFVTMRTTEARQLLPDSWGFICPVHTPDGSPCGLLNHLTVDCETSPDILHKIDMDNLIRLFVELGMEIVDSNVIFEYENYYTVIIEGKIIGYIHDSRIKSLEFNLRAYKIEGERLPRETEIVVVPKKNAGQYPGLFIFFGAARMMRPVLNLAFNKIELIGTFEQVFLEVAISKEEICEGVTTHLEFSKLSFLSNLANLIPMPDHNQAPRNMYQCQMGKQTMGTPCLNWPSQAANKLYRLYTPATPLFRPVHHDKIELDNFAMGTNAIIAVIGYTGYDMEDAMILNKFALERGFAHGTIYHTEFFEIKANSSFQRDPTKPELAKYLESDGLPMTGTKIQPNDPMCCYYDGNEAAYKVERYRGKEIVFIDNVKVHGDFSVYGPRKASITVRIPRNPNVGDKFASRAGQKGIFSQRYPAEDMPFTESGLIPDIIFNPHGFPSRMTIAMMIEIMAGKSAAIKGDVYDATPFEFSEEDTAINHFGKLLTKLGYNFFGTERLYSGFDGCEMKADIFFGIVHYQRLRHMVSDKWQVRSTGPIDSITHQPIKGRKRGGGVRFGEMERDALISHGSPFTLQDRLFHCSDKTISLACLQCQNLLFSLDKIYVGRQKGDIVRQIEKCMFCGKSDGIDIVEIPYVFKLLVSELCAMNVNLKVSFKDLN
ncbi:hypothetical protein PVAND_000476 [Polypedilum vanderplanki]|uniref:DNA-directed RNA polymerase subunit beta n=1 Tax=Polypedilum vanderplanki TaxID=319348 RepID=A0A9J6BLF0_POLVA|nr:hypothetical protein PVAND_000476 [Polypedilum vanderplanki]